MDPPNKATLSTSQQRHKRRRTTAPTPSTAAAIRQIIPRPADSPTAASHDDLRAQIHPSHDTIDEEDLVPPNSSSHSLNSSTPHLHGSCPSRPPVRRPISFKAPSELTPLNTLATQQSEALHHHKRRRGASPTPSTAGAMQQIKSTPRSL